MSPPETATHSVLVQAALLVCVTNARAASSCTAWNSSHTVNRTFASTPINMTNGLVAELMTYVNCPTLRCNQRSNLMSSRDEEYVRKVKRSTDPAVVTFFSPLDEEKCDRLGDREAKQRVHNREVLPSRRQKAHYAPQSLYQQRIACHRLSQKRRGLLDPRRRCFPS